MRRLLGALMVAVCFLGLALLTNPARAAATSIQKTDQKQTAIANPLPTTTAHDVGITRDHPASLGIESHMARGHTTGTGPPISINSGHHTGTTWSATNTANRPVPAD